MLLSLYLPSAPSGPPVSVTSSNVVPNSFSIQWQTVHCVHQNGDITSYSVQYGIQGNEHTETVVVPSSDQATTLTGLEPDTIYLVQVAGVNAQGVGDYRNLTVTTPQSGFDTPICIHIFVSFFSHIH